jgi:predicted RNA binding protein YcfA (HicA-like mRNA interferase family)
MPKAISPRGLIDRLRDFGFEGPYSGGKHMYMVKNVSLKIRIPNPHGQDISSGLLTCILRQAGISTKEWNKYR